MIKNVIIIALALAIVWFTFRPKPVEKSEAIPKDSKEYVEMKVQQVNKNIDEKGFEHAVVEALQNEISSYKQLRDSDRIELDSVNKLLKIKDKQLMVYQSTNFTVRDTVLIPVVFGDTAYKYQDKWANIEFINPKDSSKSRHFNFSYNADVKYAEYWKKKHFLAPKKQYIDFWITDPRATINGVKRVQFEAKPPTTRIEFNALGLYDRGLHIGIDGQVKFGRFRIGGGYLYNMENNTWRPIVTGRVNLLEF